jgi:hypothetical protein
MTVRGRLYFRVLGPVTAERGGASVPLGPPQLRTVLGPLLLHANRVVSVGSLADVLWVDRPPSSFRAQIRGMVSKLRAVLGEGGRRANAPTKTERPGYRLCVSPGQLDLEEFRRDVVAARGRFEAGNLESAAALFHTGPSPAGSLTGCSTAPPTMPSTRCSTLICCMLSTSTRRASPGTSSMTCSAPTPRRCRATLPRCVVPHSDARSVDGWPWPSGPPNAFPPRATALRRWAPTRGVLRAPPAVRAAGNRRGEAVLLRGLGRLAIYWDDYLQAARQLERPRDLSRQVDDKRGEAWAISGLETIGRMLGHHEPRDGLADTA